MDIATLLGDLREIILSVNDELDGSGITIDSADFEIHTEFGSEFGLNAGIGLGKLNFVATSMGKDSVVQKLSISYKYVQPDVELQGDLSEQMRKGILDLVNQIVEGNRKFPEFEMIDSSFEVNFTVDENGQIGFIFQSGSTGKYIHSMRINLKYK